MKTFTAAALALVLAAATTHTAAQNNRQPNVVLYGVVGTTGLGVGLGTQINPNLVLRGEFSRYKRSYSTKESGIDYRGDLQLQAGAVYADYHPFGGVFRVTAGLDFNAPKATLKAQTNSIGLVNVNGVPYPVPPGESITGDVQYRSTVPYFGVGWGLSGLDKPGPSFGLDIGANIGKARGSLSATNGLRAIPGFNANLATESDNFNRDVSRLKAFPVLKVSAGYAF